MSNHARGRYAAPRKSRTPILALLLLLGLAAVGCTTDDKPAAQGGTPFDREFNAQMEQAWESTTQHYRDEMCRYTRERGGGSLVDGFAAAWGDQWRPGYAPLVVGFVEGRC